MSEIPSDNEGGMGRDSEFEPGEAEDNIAVLARICTVGTAMLGSAFVLSEAADALIEVKTGGSAGYHVREMSRYVMLTGIGVLTFNHFDFRWQSRAEAARLNHPDYE